MPGPDTFLEPFGATWAILIAIQGPAGRQWGPKIHNFGISIKTQRNGVQEGVPEKYCFFNGFLCEKGEVLSVLNPPKCFIYKHLGVFR